MKINIRYFIPFLLLAVSFALGQQKELTYNQVFRYAQPRIVEPVTEPLEWFDSHHYVEYQRTGANNVDLYLVNAETGTSDILVDFKAVTELLPAGVSPLAYSDNYEYKRFLYSTGTGLYLLDTEEKNLLKITGREEEVQNATFSPDGEKIAYTKNDDLYVYDIAGKTETRLTNDGSGVVYNGYASWVYYEEILGRSSNYKAFWWSPDSRKIVFLRFDDSPVPVFTICGSEGYRGTVEKEFYPKAGDPNPLVRLGLADTENKNVRWLTEESDQYIAWPFWEKGSGSLLYQYMNREQDSLVIYRAETETGNSEPVYTEHQESWVEFFENIFLTENGGFILVSDKSGWNEIYIFNRDGSLNKKLPTEDIQIEEIEKVFGNKIFFSGREKTSVEKHLYKMDTDGSDLVQLTEEPGTHKCSVSPEGKYFTDRFSSIDDPGRLTIKNGEDGSLVRVLASAKTGEYENYKLGTTELFTIENDGYELPAKWILPPGFEKNKKYPVVISVYGGPGYEGVKNSYPRTLEPYYLAQNGIIWFSVDHRGSGHFGKAGVALMHRNLGKYEMKDYIAAVKWLEDQSFVDENKIAIEGGSYGGYVTALALTYASDYFDYGISDFPVTDWRLYDNVYTERYMDRPDENPEGYAWGNVMNHAEDYKGGLYIRHGAADDNVHPQNTLLLAGELQKLDKDFRMMIYPGERHGFRYPKRFHAIRDGLGFLFENLLGKELPE